ncbi:MAG TPA: UvrD-helicase domain-containing protein [Edaphobacter sp.]
MKRRPRTEGMGELFTFPPEPVNPEPPSTEPPDFLERQRALDVSRSWIVEAPAGSGKTGLLIQRYLKLLALPGVEQPEQVLAITFTVKATGEIRERVLEQLEHALKPDESTSAFERETRTLALAVLERDRNLDWRLLEHPRRFNVRTIDSVCAEIARSLPVLAGNAALSPVEDASTLYRLAAERTLLQLGGDDRALDDALRLILLHRDGNLAQVRDLLAEMLSLRDQWGRLIPLGHEMLEDAYLDGTVLPQIEHTLSDVICRDLSKLASMVPDWQLHELATLAAELSGNEGVNGQPSPIAICSGRTRAPGESAEDLEHWKALAHILVKPNGEWRSGFTRNYLSFEIEKGQVRRLKEIVDQLRDRDELAKGFQNVALLPPAKYPPEQWRVAKALFRVLYRALAELQIVFAERGECDFTEPGLIARAALRNEDAALETAMGTRLQHILVDEMQDTSTSQYELVELLTQGWDGHSQTVFLVGDPKQSIYLFRQARVERFIRTMQQQRLGDLELGCLRLTANFRSRGDLVRSFNRDFSRLFPQSLSDDHPEEVPYVEAQPVRSASEDALNIVWHAQVIPFGGSTEERRRARHRQARREALEIRKLAEQWRARALPHGRTTPWKIAVLVRNRAHLTDIVAELKRDRTTQPVPFRAIKIESLDERPEVLDIFALTRALLHPGDRVAWLAILRAPWCGLELTELHTLTGQDDPDLFEKTLEELILERGQDLSEESCQRLVRVWPVLQAALRQHSRLPIAEWVERTWRTLGGDAPLTTEEKTNVRIYLELLDELERLGPVDLVQLRLRLRYLYAEPSGAAGAVDLVTIHGSKGLEWDVVFVPGLEKRSRNSRSRLLTWNEIVSADEHSAAVLLAPIAGKGRDSEALNLWLDRIHRARESAESRRLFYVACTRAREELHLFASPEQNQNGSIRQNPGSLLQAAWPAAEPHFVDTQSSARPLIAPVIVLPSPAPPSAAALVLPSLAAEAEEPKRAILHRLPLDFTRPTLLQSNDKPDVGLKTASTALFKRPEGSFEARAFGTTVHAFLELLANEFAAGSDAFALLERVTEWKPRIAAVLRGHGLPPQAIENLATRVQKALTSTLGDPAGVWVLNTRNEAYSEYALRSWQEGFSSLRLDRIFRAGPEPCVDGNDHLWIVDYKTTPHTGTDLQDFFSQERERYAAQLETYARAMVNPDEFRSIRLGLYYPSLPGLTWWKLESK